MEREPNTEYVLSLSYGKDSLACLGAIEELGWPLDRIIHAEVWATDDIPADLPPMVSFKNHADKIIRERYGIEVEHLCATRNGEKLTYEKLFYHVPKRKEAKRTNGDWGGGGPKDGRSQSGAGANISKPNLPCGFPFTIGSWCKKLKDGSYPRLPYHQGKLVYQRSQTPGFPLAPLHKGRRQILCSTSELLLTSRSALNGIPNLVSKCPWWKSVGTKPIAGSGVKSGIYFPRFTRQQQGGGCWFCHNQGIDQLRLLRKTYPDLWKLLVKWDKDSPTTFKADGHTVRDYDLRFQAEDLGLVPTDRKFRWKMLTGNNIIAITKRNLLKLLEGSL